jgi:hypothetical protein
LFDYDDARYVISPPVPVGDIMPEAKTQRSPLFHLYIDETGSRHPDKEASTAKHGFDWFGLGGLLITQEDEATAKSKLATFVARWPQIRSPLHFTDIRAQKKGFAWLGNLKLEDHNRFWSDSARFSHQFRGRGLLASSIAQATSNGGTAKGEGTPNGSFAEAHSIFWSTELPNTQNPRGGGCVSTMKERTLLPTRRVHEYYETIKFSGLAFDESTSSKYRPLKQVEFQNVLLAIEGKDKGNKMMQVADSYLYAIARGSYDVKFDVYKRNLG